MKIALSIIAILLIAILIYAGTIPYDYDKSPTVVDLTSYLPTNKDKAQGKYNIPYIYHPAYINKNNSFTFHLSFNNNELPFKKIGPTPFNHLRILVRANKNISKLRSRYVTAGITSKVLSSGVVSGFNVYKTAIGKNKATTLVSYIKHDSNNYPIVIQQTENLNRRVYRSIGNGLELDYVFSKKLKLQEWDKLDRYILNILNSFKSQTMISDSYNEVLS